MTTTDAPGTRDPGRWRRWAGLGATGLGGLLALVVLLAPDRPSQLGAAALARVPIEALVGVALALLLPARPRRVAAALGGVLLGLIAVVTCLDFGFYTAFGRPFDPLSDVSFLGPAVEFVARSVGRPAAIGAAVVAGLLALGLPVLLAWALVRLAAAASHHRRAVARTTAVLTVLWVACAAFGVRVGADLPVAAAGGAERVAAEAGRVRADLRDRDAFASESAVDAFGDTPAAGLLTALRGKDVVVAFVESYGRVAVEDPAVSGVVGAALDEGQRRLRAAGFAARSAFVGSPTSGGGSWLAHATLQSGLWIYNQRRYADVTASDRLTLTGAFRRAGWRTVSVAPANTGPWPEGQFFGYDRSYGAADLGYRGPSFSFSSIPDQFTLSALQRLERAAGHRPVMAEVDLLSSHAPWSPVPSLLPWTSLGDGSAYQAGAGAKDKPESVLSRAGARVRADYGRSIAYSLDALTSYIATYGDNDLVVVFLGDHQPAPVVAGEKASPDAPITIVAHDPAVLARVASWGWQDGLRPSPSAPVWRMDTFRDRFLTVFG